MTKVVVFSGGRGATTILASLARTSGVRLHVVVNAYDSGLSTGRVRRAIPGILGPSDIRKASGTLATAIGDRTQRNLAALLEARLHSGAPALRAGEDPARTQFDAIAAGDLDALTPEVRPLVRTLSLETWAALSEHMTAFQKSLLSAEVDFSYDDLALGNAVLAGMYVQSDMNRAVDRYQDLLGLVEQRVENVTQGEDLWLCAVAGEFLCPDEGTLVATTPPAPIDDLLLVSADVQRAWLEGRTGWLRDPALIELVRAAGQLPAINPRVDEALRTADVIVYGPGTQHSSFFPSYLTMGVGEAVAANLRAEKIFVANIDRDLDQFHDETVADMLRKFRFFMTRRQTINLTIGDLVSSVLVDDSELGSLQALDGSIATRSALWSDPTGRHSGSAVKEEISSAVRLRSGEQLSGDSGLVTIIVPVLNEVDRVGPVLQQLRYLDLNPLNLLHEIVVVDGGSSDGTLDVIHAEPDVHVIDAQCAGRGAAVHLGFQRARGEFVIVFPADGEYDPNAILEVIRALQNDPEVAVLASRTLGGSSASNRLRAVYGENRLLYLMSHWGGVLVTLLLMLRLDRVIGDPMSGVRGARRDLFGALDNTGTALDYDVAWVKRAVEGGHRVVEVPVTYRPRSWRDGKKTDIWDGLRALRAVFHESRRGGKAQ